MNISTILNEEICKFLIKENLSSLVQLSNELKSLVEKVCKIPVNNMSENARNSIYKVEYYSMQIIFAIERCESNNNLNESSDGWGMDILRNLYYDYLYGYRRTKNLLRGRNGSDQYMNSNAESSNTDLNQTNVRSEKLSVLLSRVGKMEQTYYAEESTYKIDVKNPNISKGIRDIFQKIKEIYQEYLLLTQNNSQGNP